MNSRRLTILVAWSHLPVYAAHALEALCADPDVDITIVATEPPAGRGAIERIISTKIFWLDDGTQSVSLDDLGLTPPNVVMTSGYHTSAFNSIAEKCRSLGSLSVLMCDHNWRGSIRQMLGDRIRYSLMLRRRYDAMMVPGRSGMVYASKMGFSAQDIFSKLYGANPILFNGVDPISHRSKRFLFVGQLIKRKNVLNICRAFETVRGDLVDWRLTICGDGPLKPILPRNEQVQVMDFISSEGVAELMRDTRVFLLPSKIDHWGVVLHEAALSGCALITTKGVGAHEDLCNKQNSIVVNGSARAIAKAMTEMAGLSDREFDIASTISKDLAQSFGPKHFRDSVKEMLKAHRL